MAIQNSEGFGLHLTLDGYGGQKEKLADLKLARSLLNKLPVILGMTKISQPQVIWYDGRDKPEDCGVSGFVLIAESHISIHTFCLKGFLTADVYSCRSFNPSKPIEFIKKEFELKELEINTIKRGLKFPRKVAQKPTFEIPVRFSQ